MSRSSGNGSARQLRYLSDECAGSCGRVQINMRHCNEETQRAWREKKLCALCQAAAPNAKVLSSEHLRQPSAAFVQHAEELYRGGGAVAAAPSRSGAPSSSIEASMKRLRKLTAAKQKRATVGHSRMILTGAAAERTKLLEQTLLYGDLDAQQVLLDKAGDDVARVERRRKKSATAATTTTSAPQTIDSLLDMFSSSSESSDDGELSAASDDGDLFLFEDSPAADDDGDDEADEVDSEAEEEDDGGELAAASEYALLEAAEERRRRKKSSGSAVGRKRAKTARRNELAGSGLVYCQEMRHGTCASCHVEDLRLVRARLQGGSSVRWLCAACDETDFQLNTMEF